MDVTLPFKTLDEALRGRNPITYGIMPLRIRSYLYGLTKSEKRNLKEYANIENGIVERYILVPGNITVIALEFAIDKCFGLMPEMYCAATVLADDEMSALFPTLGDVIDNFGYLFGSPDEDELVDSYMLTSEALERLSLIGGPLYPKRVKLNNAISKKLRKKFEKEINEGVEYDGKVVPITDIPTSWKTFEEYFDEEGECPLTISPDIDVRALIAQKGVKLNNLKTFNRYLKDSLIHLDTPIKPITRTLKSIRYDEECNIAFEFYVDIPSSIEFIIEDGYLSLEEYLESVQYVANSFLPDCIYKSGYDLNGLNVRDYYNFIMSLHLGIPQFLHDIIRATGWREPLLDYKRIMRE